MKNIFRGFYSASQQELGNLWKDDKTLFVFDANVLLNLYGYALQTRNDFFKILKSIEGQIWIPYHAGLEYQKRRLEVIKNEKSIFSEIDRNLDKVQNVFKSDFEQLALKRRFPKLAENTERLEKEISRSIASYRKSVAHWNSEQPCVRSHDSIRDDLNSLFEGKVGEKPKSQEWLDNLYKEGAERFRNRIPPGFKDASKAKKEEDTHFFYDGLNYERQFGDLIIWKQIIQKSKEKDIASVIFVTDDAKDDWWYKIHSNGNKVIGPLAEIQAEIFGESDISAFHMYSTSMFMKDSESYLSVEVDENSIIDARASHSKPRHKYRADNLNQLRDSQNFIVNEYLKKHESSFGKLSEIMSQNRFPDDLEKFRNLEYMKNHLPTHFDEYKNLSNKASVEAYKYWLDKYNTIFDENNMSTYSDIIRKYENVGSPSEIQRLFDNLDASKNEESDEN
ncbi:MAG: PIN-like domain-containing protein [Pseudohongiella sp.]|uniref:PIN-like domain-containing protein n=1 Tax=Pseudohongiella sp. TaxID=1979412 RepID=UPI0034A09A2A